jgi:PAS domain S-box-containing protein
MGHFEVFYPIINGIPVALAITDKEGLFMEVNDAYCKLLEYNKEELLGQSGLEMGIISEDSRESIIRDFYGSDKKLLEYEISYHTKSRKLRYALISANTLTLDGENYNLITFNDVTERKLAEIKSKETKLYLEKITSNVLGMVYEYRLVNGVMQVEFMSNGSYELLGLTSEQIISDVTVLWKVVHPDDVERLAESMEKTSREGTVWENEYRMRHTDGTYKWIYGRSVEQERTANGEIVRIGTLVDVSNRIKAEEAQKLSDDRLRQTIDMTPNMAIQWFNRDGEILFWNPASERMYGYTKEEAVGKPLSQLIQFRGKSENFLQMIQEMERTNIPVGPYETQLHDKYGTTKTVLASTFMISGNTNEPIFVCMDIDITDQKKYEAELVKTNQFLNTLLNSIPVMVCWKDENSKYRGANKLFLEIVNSISEEELMGKTDIELFGIERASVFTEFDRDVFSTGKAKVFYEDPFVNAKGKEGWLLKSKTPIKSPDGQIIGILVTGQDITERKQIEIALQQSESKYRSLFENMTSAFALHQMIYDENGDPFDYRYLELNPAFKRLTGVRPELILGRTVKEILPDTEKYWIDIFGNVAKTGEPFYYENFSQEFGKWYDTYAFSPQKDQFAVVFNDSTARKEAERALQESEELFRNVVKNAQAIIYVIDKDGYFTLSEGLALEKMHLKAGEIVGKNAFELYRDYHDIIEKIRSALNGEIAESETEIDGAVFGNRYSPTFDEDGNIKGIICVSIDITERRRAENELSRLNNELEQKVRERTLQLQEANNELESFAYSISHDLRAPIRHIDGFAKIMFKGIVNPSELVIKNFNRITDSSKRMSQMIDDLLAFSRLGRRELQKREVDMDRLILGIIETQSHTSLSETKVDWNILPLGIAVGDESLLQMAFENLISNAIKYSSKKENPIIEIGKNDTNTHFVEYYIKDNGAGFEMAYAEKLFNIFQRLHTTEEFEGTGIGLANVRQIIKKHGGTVKGEGKVNEGAVFYISLPLK